MIFLSFTIVLIMQTWYSCLREIIHMEEKDMAVKKKETKETKVNTAPVEVRVKEVDDKVALA